MYFWNIAPVLWSTESKRGRFRVGLQLLRSLVVFYLLATLLIGIWTNLGKYRKFEKLGLESEENDKKNDEEEEDTFLWKEGR